MILGKYKITYANGIFQFKNLISHNDYLNDIKVVEDKIYEIERKNKFKENKESSELKSYLKNTYGIHWFTDKSPLFYGIKDGNVKLLPQQGGIHKVKFEKL